MAAQRDLIAWTADVAGAMAKGARGLSPEGERKLAERVAAMAAAAMRSEVPRIARGAMRRAVLARGGGIAFAVLVSGAGGYWLGRRAETVTLQFRPGEIAAMCQGAAVQQAPDGDRICATWIRLGQAGLVGR